MEMKYSMRKELPVKIFDLLKGVLRPYEVEFAMLKEVAEYLAQDCASTLFAHEGREAAGRQ